MIRGSEARFNNDGTTLAQGSRVSNPVGSFFVAQIFNQHGPTSTSFRWQGGHSAFAARAELECAVPGRSNVRITGRIGLCQTLAGRRGLLRPGTGALRGIDGTAATP